MKDLMTATFNPGKGWFELYMPNGEKVPNLQQCTITDIFDLPNQDKNGFMDINFQCIARVHFTEINKIKNETKTN